MKLIFITEARFIKGVDGTYYGESSFNYKLWERYLESFTAVIVIARVKIDQNYIGDINVVSSGPRVTFVNLPYYIGPLGYIKNKSKIKEKFKENVFLKDTVYLFRLPGIIGAVGIKELQNAKIQYGVEVVGDPWDVFARGSINHPLRMYFRWSGYIRLKKNVSKASGALYVTKKTLQERYPVAQERFQTSASNVILEDRLLAIEPKKYPKNKIFTFISVGSLEQMYKAPDVVVKALRILKNQGVKCKFVWLGGGINMNEMKQLAIELGVEELIVFKGNVGAKLVRSFLLDADVFVLASRTEGLPRAMIEAMAVGLPCIGTRVGGIPELLNNTVLVDKDSPLKMAGMMRKIIENESFYNDQAVYNLKEANQYKESVLKKKRTSFYEYLKNNIT